MACSSCKSRNTTQSYIKRTSNEYVPDPNCQVTIQDLSVIYDRLVCYQMKKTGKNVNQHLGNVISMINREDYCMFDIEQINNFLNGSDC